MHQSDKESTSERPLQPHFGAGRHIAMPDVALRVNEIFYSIQGEGTRAGMPCVFVRLHGCKLRCSWCDTTYAIDRRSGGNMMSAAAIYRELAPFDCSFIEFTGGEPLEQEDVLPLMEWYCDEGFTVAVETGGHVDVGRVDPRVIKIVDMKCPDSRMESLNNYDNLNHLQPHDEVKFVINSRRDYEWARSLLCDTALDEKCAAVLFSPVFGAVDYQEMVGWILADHLPVRFQLQMHKFIWDPEMRGV